MLHAALGRSGSPWPCKLPAVPSHGFGCLWWSAFGGCCTRQVRRRLRVWSRCSWPVSAAGGRSE
eukprot:12927880-Alexandrium_andersonii.AAC.1